MTFQENVQGLKLKHLQMNHLKLQMDEKNREHADEIFVQPILLQDTGIHDFISHTIYSISLCVLSLKKWTMDGSRLLQRYVTWITCMANCGLGRLINEFSKATVARKN